MISDVDQLIIALVTGIRDPTGHDLARIRRHVMQAGFDPQATFGADRRVVGLRRLAGPAIQPGERIPTDEVHFLRHVVARAEWPTGTTLHDYESSLRALAARPQAGILVSEVPPFGHHVAIVGRSGRWLGPAGFDWMLVEYRVSTGHWATGHQLRDGLAFANRRRRKRWLRLPT